ncbi:hypothetical protein Glove_450g25 [Diversispora epigaea]|uniref:Uncharacterized protein n=1 Tax=Diversispora epigaea TaxID=1348612 RepID=A0A397GUQ0_9GLOM|nr:hypothetical protein Glove_450g25 [Diversispora epigaea]
MEGTYDKIDSKIDRNNKINGKTSSQTGRQKIYEFSNASGYGKADEFNNESSYSETDNKIDNLNQIDEIIDETFDETIDETIDKTVESKAQIMK